MIAPTGNSPALRPRSESGDFLFFNLFWYLRAVPTFLNILWLGISQPFKNTSYRFLFLALLLLGLAFLILAPVWIVAGNNLKQQLEIFVPRDYLVMILLAGLYALFLTMQIYAFRQKKRVGVGTAAGGVGGGLGTFLAGIAGTASCASCLAPLFALFGIGFGSTLFVLEYRFYLLAAVILLMLIAIYLTARKITNLCSLC